MGLVEAETCLQGHRALLREIQLQLHHVKEVEILVSTALAGHCGLLQASEHVLDGAVTLPLEVAPGLFFLLCGTALTRYLLVGLLALDGIRLCLQKEPAHAVRIAAGVFFVEFTWTSSQGSQFQLHPCHHKSLPGTNHCMALVL